MCNWNKCHNFDRYSAGTYGCGKKPEDKCNFAPKGDLIDVTNKVTSHTNESISCMSQDRGRDVVFIKSSKNSGKASSGS